MPAHSWGCQGGETSCVVGERDASTDTYRAVWQYTHAHKAAETHPALPDEIQQDSPKEVTPARSSSFRAMEIEMAPL